MVYSFFISLQNDSLCVLPFIARAAAATATKPARLRSSRASDEFTHAVFVLKVDSNDLPAITVGVFRRRCNDFWILLGGSSWIAMILLLLFMSG